MSDEPIGAEGIDSSQVGSHTEGSDSAPAPLAVQDDTMIVHPKLNGGKPIKYSEAFKGFQSEFTKASQKAANLERTLAERSQRLEALERAAEAARNQPGGTTPQQALAELKSAPYITGEQQANIVVGIASALKQRDEVITGLIRTVQGMKQHLDSLVGQSTNSAFDGKINRWLQDGGIPAEAAEWAKEVYLAYEPTAELDEEFPGILAARWKQLNGLFETGRKAQLTAARKSPWVPGKGSDGRPSKPLQATGRESPKDIAEQVWESMLGPGVET